MTKKFGDISSRRKPTDDKALQEVVNGGQVTIKDKKLSDNKVPFQVMIDAKMKNDIKVKAAIRGIKMNELFMEMYLFYEKHHKP